MSGLDKKKLARVVAKCTAHVSNTELDSEYTKSDKLKLTTVPSSDGVEHR